MNLSRIDRRYLHILVSAALHDGTETTLTGVDVALLPPRTTPTDDTTWTPANYADGAAVVLIAGPDADPEGALVIEDGGMDLWVRVIDGPETVAVHVTRITAA